MASRIDRPADINDSQHSGVNSSCGSSQCPLEPLKGTSTWKQPWTSSWAWEICAALFSMACLVAVISVVAVMHERPLALWRLPISPNALLALFSTFAKSSALLVLAECIGQLKWIYFQQRPHLIKDFAHFDEASRGPLGALQFLYEVRGRAFVASVGCIVVIATLAMEPFTQQVLSFPLRHIPTNSSSTEMRVTQTYRNFLHDDNTMKALWMSSFQIPNDYTCNFENCTWVDFTSLEICNTCVDVRPTLDIACETSGTHNDHVWCKYTFPDSQVLFAKKSFGDDMDVHATVFNITGRIPSEPDAGSLASIATINMIAISNRHLQDPEALQCSLRWCARSYRRLSVTPGSLEADYVTHELRLSRAFNSDNYPHLWDLYTASIPSAYPGEKVPSQDLDKLKHTFHNMPRNPEMFFIDFFGYKRMLVVLQSVFAPGAFPALVLQDVLPGSWVNATKELPLRFFQASNGNYSKAMDNFAAALTHQIKLPNGITLQGQVQKPEQYVHVSWPWLLVSGLIVPLSTIFLLVTIRLSSEDSRFVWKTSTLSLLFHGLHGWEVNAFASSRSRAEMKELSRSMRAQLQSDESGNIFLKRE